MQSKQGDSLVSESIRERPNGPRVYGYSWESWTRGLQRRDFKETEVTRQQQFLYHSVHEAPSDPI